jgi:hypothetical protein
LVISLFKGSAQRDAALDRDWALKMALKSLITGKISFFFKERHHEGSITLISTSSSQQLK